MMRVPTTIPFSIDWLPDGQLLVVAGQRLGGSVVAAGGGDARGGAADRTWWVRHNHDGYGRRRTPTRVAALLIRPPERPPNESRRSASERSCDSSTLNRNRISHPMAWCWRIKRPPDRQIAEIRNAEEDSPAFSIYSGLGGLPQDPCCGGESSLEAKKVAGLMPIAADRPAHLSNQLSAALRHQFVRRQRFYPRPLHVTSHRYWS